MEKKKYKFVVTMTPTKSGYRCNVNGLEVDDIPVEKMSAVDLQRVGDACFLIGEEISAHLHSDEEFEKPSN